MSAVAEEKQIIKGGAFLIEERTTNEIFTPEDFTEEHLVEDLTRQQLRSTHAEIIIATEDDILEKILGAKRRQLT